MFCAGLVSVSFRSLSVDDIIELAKSAGLSCIEWGSDVHAPRDDDKILLHIAKKQKEAGLFCSSYGTYFTLGKDTTDQLCEYIRAARILGTDTLRIWCSKKSWREHTAEERELLLSEAKRAAWIAESHGVRLCLECHSNTYTDEVEGALDIMREVGSQAFLMYWQPNQNKSEEQNIEYAERISPYTVNIHVFNWKGKGKYPLREASDIWSKYLRSFDGTQRLLLEFMPDGLPASLGREAMALRDIIGEVKI